MPQLKSGYKSFWQDDDHSNLRVAPILVLGAMTGPLEIIMSLQEEVRRIATVAHNAAREAAVLPMRAKEQILMEMAAKIRRPPGLPSRREQQRPGYGQS